MNSHGIQIPSWTWKTALVLDRPGLGLEDVSATTPTYAIITPNTPEPTSTDFQNGGVQHPLDTLIPLSSPRPRITSQAEWRNWETWRVTVDQLEDLLKTTPGLSTFDLMPEVRHNIQRAIEATISPVVAAPNFLLGEDDSDSSIEAEDNGDEPLISSSLLGTEDQFLTDSIFNRMGTLQESSIWKSGVAKESTLVPSSLIVSSSHISSSQINSSHVSPTEIGIFQISTDQLSPFKSSIFQISTNEAGFSQVSESKLTSSQVGVAEVTSTHIVGTEVSTTKICLAQNCSSNGLSDRIIFFPTSCPTQISISEFNSEKISFPSGITLKEFISSHVSESHSTSLQNTNVFTWIEFLQTQAPFNLNLSIQDLPAGQLAEAQITQFNAQGQRLAGTLLLDHDANGLGWFIDLTPFENSEFAIQNSEFALKATQGSAAYGRYDLLTTILHELGHLAGIISGNPTYDQHIQTISGSPVFVGDGFTAQLTPDRSHLDSRYYPYDLMNTHLAPGVRKLPSALDLQILNAIRSSTGWNEAIPALTAPLTTTPLIGITDGTFDTPDAWDTRGGTTLLNGQATLTEESRFLSNLSQTFIIPEGAKYLQFTLVDTHLGISDLAPPDAFEVALLDAYSLTPLVGTAAGLTQTDSLLNLQHNGQAYFGSQVTLAGAPTSGSQVSLNSPPTVKIDISGIAPGTLATLYFDLLGFGKRDGSVTIDDVVLLKDGLNAPTAQNDTALTVRSP